MTTSFFQPEGMTDEDLKTAVAIVGDFSRLLRPDLVIAPDGVPYLYRWFALPYDARRGQVYFHIQTLSDPERPLHDHPWDNQSVILSGGYNEVLQKYPPYGLETVEERREGDVVQRKAGEAHRLVLPDSIPYTMSLFTTGPEVKDWGFWLPSHEWVSHRDVTAMENGVSVWKDKR